MLNTEEMMHSTIQRYTKYLTIRDLPRRPGFAVCPAAKARLLLIFLYYVGTRVNSKTIFVRGYMLKLGTIEDEKGS
jgi:hypothetical protein